ncbi:MAG: hypothetical protein AB7I18_10645 [Candidatus Berkiella sp.]
MRQFKILGAFCVMALVSTAAFAIEGGGGRSGDRDRVGGSNWSRHDGYPGNDREGYYGGYYHDEQLRARHQQGRYDDSDYSNDRDFDVQGRMNN